MILAPSRPSSTPALKIGAAAALLVALVAMGFFVFAAGPRPELVALTAGGLLVTAVCLREPRLVAPVIILTLPLEISKLWFPFLPVREEMGGGLPPTSVFDVGRLAIMMAAVIWVVRPGVGRSEVAPTSILALPAFLLLAVYALSVLWAHDMEAARTEALRFAFLLGLWALVPVFVRDLRALRWCIIALIVSAALLALAGVYQQLTGTFFWNEGLGLYGERRINATFADPNHFARLLVVALVLGLALFFFVKRRARFVLLVPALAVCVLTLVFTGSRSAWIIAIAMLPLVVFALPLPVNVRLRVFVLTVFALVWAVGLCLAASPYFRERLGTFRSGMEASGARMYLVEAGWEMFRDHPVQGVGAGGYQNAFADDYFYFKDPKIKANVTVSHTSAMTTIAELGVLGAAVSLFLLYRWGLLGLRLHRRSRGEMRALVVGLWVVSLVILLSSQTEGRFFEDPYLWIVLGLGAAMERMLANGVLRQETAEDAPLLPR